MTSVETGEVHDSTRQVDVAVVVDGHRSLWQRAVGSVVDFFNEHPMASPTNGADLSHEVTNEFVLPSFYRPRR